MGTILPKFPLLTAITLFLTAILTSGAEETSAVPEYGYAVVRVFPHDRASFTQGLEYHAGKLFEGTGLNGHSRLIEEELETGKAIQQKPVPQQYFGEGISVIGNHLIELTWQSHVGFVYDVSTFRLISDFSYPGEGWGLTNDGHNLYMSDGTAEIRVLDPGAMRELRRISVRENGKPVINLNELEWIRGEVWANVWTTDDIVRIRPSDGVVTGVIHLPGLLTQQEREEGADVLNGIAYDAEHDRIFVTGKLWPKLFEIRLVPKS